MFKLITQRSSFIFSVSPLKFGFIKLEELRNHVLPLNINSRVCSTHFNNAVNRILRPDEFPVINLPTLTRHLQGLYVSVYKSSTIRGYSKRMWQHMLTMIRKTCTDFTTDASVQTAGQSNLRSCSQLYDVKFISYSKNWLWISTIQNDNKNYWISELSCAKSLL